MLNLLIIIGGWNTLLWNQVIHMIVLEWELLAIRYSLRVHGHLIVPHVVLIVHSLPKVALHHLVLLLGHVIARRHAPILRHWMVEHAPHGHLLLHL